MSKKVLILSGSPRKAGNSEILCDKFAKGAGEAGHHVETISVRGKNLGFCTACDGCQQNPGKCVLEDDMTEILAKMVEADVIVMATPVYFYSIDAQMKVVIDRTYARYMELRDKEFYFIMTAADKEKGALGRTLGCFRGFTDCLPGAKEKGVVYGTGAWAKGEIRSSDAMQQAYDYGKQI